MYTTAAEDSYGSVFPDGGGAFFTLRCYLRHAKRSVRLLEAGLPGVSLKSDSAAEGAMELPPMGLAVRNELAILQRLARRLHKVGKMRYSRGEGISEGSTG